MNNIRSRGLEKEFAFKASSGSGPGGQHVNRTSSKVELRFHIGNSQLLSEQEKARLLSRLSSRITEEGELILTSQQSRSQHINKKDVQEKFFDLLENALKPRKKRKKTRPTKASKEKRLKKKKQHGQKKQNRKPPEL